MKKTTKKLTVFILTFMFIFLSGITFDVNAATIKLNQTSATIAVGKSTTLKIDGVKSSKVKWKSSKKSVAKVSSKGKVTGVKTGTATITGTYKKIKFKCKVTVQPKSYTYNKTVYSDSYVKIVVKSISSNGVVLKVTNKSNELISFDGDYVQLDNTEYTYDKTGYSSDMINIVASNTRQYTFGDSSILKITNPKCSKFSGVFGVWDTDGYLIKYVNISNVSLK